jgi:hypothetical protein
MKETQDFWSRRKQAVEAEADAEVADQIASEEQQTLEALEKQTDDEILEELGLQDPDGMEKGDDFSAFMSKAVPTRLRNRALRKLWLSDPALANLDTLVDYGEDFTDSAMAVENIQTAYQVGKGMLSHVMEMARQEEAKLSDTQGEDDSLDLKELSLDEYDLAEEEENSETEAEITADLEIETPIEILEADETFATKKRMRFVIEGASLDPSMTAEQLGG